MKTYLSWLLGFLLTFSAVGLFGGCSSIPSAKKLEREARRAHKTGDYTLALEKMQTLEDVYPGHLADEREEKARALYQELQSLYGTQQAELASSEGRLLDAWVWYTQLALLATDSESSNAAAEKATKLYSQIGEKYCGEARRALSNGDRSSAIEWATRALWFGGGRTAENIFAEATGVPNANGVTGDIRPVQPNDVAARIRTDNHYIVAPDDLFAPYGLPIFFGEPRRYYLPVKEIMVKGYPVYSGVPESFKKADPLLRLTKAAKKKAPMADGLINVRLWTKSKKQYVRADAVKFIEFDD